MPLEPRRLADRYELAAPVERGPDATVWRARDRSGDRDVAVHHLRFDTVPDGEREHVRRRILVRARRAATIHHQSVVAVHDAFEDDGDLYVVTDHTPAPTLADLVDLHGPLDETSVAVIGERLAAALAAIHGAGSAHGRITADHVLVPAVDEPRLRCVAPELDGRGGGDGGRGSERSGEDGPAADVWALGAVLRQAVEGRPPAAGHEPQAGDEQRPALASLLDDALAADPRQRPAAEELRVRLARLGSERDRGGPQETSGPAPEIPPHLRFDATGDVEERGGATAGADRTPPPVTDDTRWDPAGTGHQPVTPATGVVPGRGGDTSQRRSKLIAAAAALIAVVGIAAALVTVSGDAGDDRSGDAATEAAGATGQDPGPAGDARQTDTTDGDADATGDADTDPEPAADGEAPPDDAVPDGWETHETSRYRFAHPPAWDVQALTSVTTQFRDPRTGTYVRITTGGSGSDPVGEWRAYEGDFAARHGDYRRVRIEPFEVRGEQGAVWEYTYTDGGAQLHAVNIKIPTGDGGYAFNLQSKAEHWDDVSARLETFLAAFEPAG